MLLEGKNTVIYCPGGAVGGAIAAWRADRRDYRVPRSRDPRPVRTAARAVRLTSRTAVLSDARWDRIEPLMPSSDGQRGRPFRDHRQVLEGII